MRPNKYFLINALCLLAALIGVAMGARLYRWEAVVWILLGINNAVCAYLYSKWWAEK